VTDNKYCAEKLALFVGATIVDIVFDPASDTIGLEVDQEGERCILWILSDSEGNDGGFIEAILAV
jgi:hypothetical protein